ncbi:flagellin N-terminal helical domain-containing protein [Halomonas alkalisoli]|uniref:flagellin N-terminal helical domain-containing protein n=1 Tax=Halomonas alkalisoli TaxID=2907158 RepID=UPI00272EB9FD|nr:flagellin [Halomonas alkalisoli]
MSVINTNITSMIGQANLQKSQNALQTSMERLSSGLRINSAKDDAAGQAIANRMTSQINGLSQAQRNANDGISVAQTAEGGLNQINDNLQRIRELSVQAQNGTNSDNDLQSIQDEITQRLDEIDRISKETNFNGTDVLAADRGLNIQVGANDGEQITVNLKEITSATLNLSNFDVTNESLATSKLSSAPVTETVAATLNIQDATFADSATAAAYDIFVEDANPDNVIVVNQDTGEGFTATYNSETGALEFDTSSAVGDGTGGDVAAATVTADYSQVTGTDGVSVGGGVTIEAQDLENGAFVDQNPAATPELFVNENGDFVVSLDGGTTYHDATVDFDSTSATYGQVSFDSSTAATNDTTNLSASLDKVSNPAPSVAIDTSGLDTALVGDAAEVYSHEDGGYVVKGEVEGQTVYFSATVDDETGVVTLGDKLNSDPLASLDAALNQVDSLRSELGAVQNRFEDAINNLSTNETNLAAARSRIEDADYAVEVANMTRAQILQQAGTSVLAQANQVPQNVLSLLG